MKKIFELEWPYHFDPDYLTRSMLSATLSRYGFDIRVKDITPEDEKERTLNVEGKEYPLLSIIWDQYPTYHRAVLADGKLTIVRRSKEPYGVEGIEQHYGWKFVDSFNTTLIAKDKDEENI